MKFIAFHVLAAAAFSASMFAPLSSARAQPVAGAVAPVTRSEVKMERTEFLKTHRWSEEANAWMLKAGVEPPAGIKPRVQVKAERDEFLRRNRWDESTGTWISLAGAPRNLAGLSRAQVKSETTQFLRTHRWDESDQSWVASGKARK